MYQVIYHEDNRIELRLTDTMSDKEFKEVIHQLESLCTMHPKINILFDAIDLDNFDVSLLMDDFDFYKEYRKHLDRVAIVSDKSVQNLLVKMFNPFSEAELKSFPGDKIEDARKWIFPTKLP